MHSLLTLNFASTIFFEFEKTDTKIHPEKRPLFRHSRRHARIHICHYLITIKLVLNMVKAAKAVKNNNTSQSSSSSSSATSSATSSFSAAASSCTPPTIRNGAKKNDRFFILNPEEQNAFKKYVSEIKQISGLILLKCGLGVQECKVISQKMQEDYLSKNIEKVYTRLTQDPIIGKRVIAIPFKFLNVATSVSREILSGSKLRKRYSAMKTYINNTLSPLWPK